MNVFKTMIIFTSLLLWASVTFAGDSYHKPKIKFASKFANEPVKVYEEDWDSAAKYRVHDKPVNERNVASDPVDEDKKWERHPSSQPVDQVKPDQPLYWKYNHDLVD